MHVSDAASLAKAFHDLSTGRKTAVLREARRLLQRYPDDWDVRYLLALAELEAGEADAAAPLLEQLVEERPGQVPVRTNWALALREAGELARAEDILVSVLQVSPENAPAKYNLACILFDQRKYKAALQHFSILTDSCPDNASYRLGVADCLRCMERPVEAVTCYRQIIDVDPLNPQARLNLANLLTQLGEFDEALESADAMRALCGLPKDLALKLGRLFFSHECFDEAMEVYAQAFESDPDCEELLQSIALTWLEVGDLPEAAGWFQRLDEINPDGIDGRLGLGAVASRAGDSAAAIQILKVLNKENPDNVDVALRLAESLWDEGLATEAIELLRNTDGGDTGSVSSKHLMASIMLSLGRTQEASQMLHEVLELRPFFAPALSNLAHHSKASLSTDLVARMDNLLMNKRLGPGPRASLHSGLGAYHDSAGNFAEAVHHSSKANEMQWSSRSKRDWDYSPDQHAAAVDNLVASFTSERISLLASGGMEAMGPVFIIGMPRSGTTLTEQIIASHPEALGIGERNFAAKFLNKLQIKLGSESVTPDLMDLIEPHNVRELALEYWDELALIREQSSKPGATVIVDKMPDNYLYAGWIRSLFPRAPIISARRDPRDVALSCWFTQFRSIPWACDMGHIAQRLEQYFEIMRHWNNHLPGPFMQSHYEQLVAEQERQTRRLLDFVGLEYHSQCLDFHQSEYVVRTASVSQVRQPIYKKSVNRWKNYSELLGPVERVMRRNQDFLQM